MGRLLALPANTILGWNKPLVYLDHLLNYGRNFLYHWFNEHRGWSESVRENVREGERERERERGRENVRV
jgi:hypothetical protein